MAHPSTFPRSASVEEKIRQFISTPHDRDLPPREVAVCATHKLTFWRPPAEHIWCQHCLEWAYCSDKCKSTNEQAHLKSCAWFKRKEVNSSPYKEYTLLELSFGNHVEPKVVDAGGFVFLSRHKPLGDMFPNDGKAINISHDVMHYFTRDEVQTPQVVFWQTMFRAGLYHPIPDVWVTKHLGPAAVAKRNELGGFSMPIHFVQQVIAREEISEECVPIVAKEVASVLTAALAGYKNTVGISNDTANVFNLHPGEKKGFGLPDSATYVRLSGEKPRGKKLLVVVVPRFPWLGGVIHSPPETILEGNIPLIHNFLMRAFDKCKALAYPNKFA